MATTKKTASKKKPAARKRTAPLIKTKKSKSSKRKKVLITGISGRTGRLVAKRLHREYEVHGVDRVPFVGAPKDIQLHMLDLRKKRCENLFRNFDFEAVYHLGIVHNPRLSADEHHSFNVTGTMKILEYCQKYNVPKVVLMSSALIYGPHPNNPAFLTEDAPLLAGTRFPQIRDQIELDMVAQSFFWKNTEIETAILRPVHVVGPHMTNAFTNYLRLSRIPKLIGFDPLVQVVHEDDLVEALYLSMKPGIRGIFNIAGPSAVPLSTIIDVIRKPSFPVPHFMAGYLMEKLYQLKISDIPAPEVDYARYICNVDTTRAKEILGFAPELNLEQTLSFLR